MNRILIQKDTLQQYVKADSLIDFTSNLVSSLAEKLELSEMDEISATKRAYEYVRDNFPHTFDVDGKEVACSASDVIKLGHGICYAKAHLLTALLRYAGIPAGICYQRICLDTPAVQNFQKLSGISGLSPEPGQQSTSGEIPQGKRLVLHAVNAVYLKSLNRWVRMDVRGNTNGINAQFSLEHEHLAFSIHPQFDEEDGSVIYSETPPCVAHALYTSHSARQFKDNLPSYIPDKEAILFTANRPEVVMEKGKGMYMWDTVGKKYLDFVGGWAVNCLGHSPNVITEALVKQSSTLLNCSPSFYNTQMLKFARLLTQNSCFHKVFFASSGAEANEGAIKLARKFGSKFKSGAYEIITTVNSFHGRTLATMSATGKRHWEPLFAPKVSGFVHVPFNDIEAVKSAITEKTCAIMLEPIQGEGGVNIAELYYISKLRKLCDENNILLIFDEIQTGIGRTGKLFAYQHYEVEPDIMTLAKGIGGGFPLSAMLTKKQFDIFDPGDQGGSYSSQPLAMSVGFAVVSEVIEKAIPGHAEKIGNYLVEELNNLKEKYNLSNIRGMGLLAAFDLASPIAVEVVAKCLEDGLAINSPQPSTIRLMPPLIVKKSEIDEMISILCKVLDQDQFKC
ncbi:MAG: acetylornithine/succinylornithine aminotransferase [Eubacterium sp.]|jgi:acetylornithine/N-succinyldiaminopimelate aminotransferase|nr:acetylornithine/succinylornithine aminotransferase [Eubacterium sp.]